MFPNSFSARVAERMAIWGALIGFLLFLYGAVEVIQANRMTEILDDRRQATNALMSYVEAPGSGAAVDARRAELGKTIAKRIQSIDQRQAALRDSHRQNEMLIGLLALFIVGRSCAWSTAGWSSRSCGSRRCCAAARIRGAI